MIQILPLAGLPEIGAGADLGALLSEALETVPGGCGPDDLLVVTQKIVSKAEGRWIEFAAVVPSPRAHELARLTGKPPDVVQLVLDESCAVVRAAPNILITRHRRGFVMANAGIDQSNLGPGEAERVLLLPEDPDASAERLREALRRRGPAPGIVISDSFGRPWRNGVTAVAIGAAAFCSLIDRRGDVDREGRMLQVTQIALADLAACAAALAMGEAAEGVPAALIRGLPPLPQPVPASALVRPAEQDLFL